MADILRIEKVEFINKWKAFNELTPKEKMLEVLSKCKSENEAFAAAGTFNSVLWLYKSGTLSHGSLSAALQIIMANPDMEIPNGLEIGEIFEKKLEEKARKKAAAANSSAVKPNKTKVKAKTKKKSKRKK